MSKFLKQNKLFPYLIIEDDIMSKLRRIDYRDFIISHQDSKWSKWMFNGVTEEATRCLINCYRYNIYFDGLCKILKRLILGDDFKLNAGGEFVSLQGVCDKLKESDNLSRQGNYAFQAQKKNSVSQDEFLRLYQWKPPFQVNEIHFNRSEYDDYIAQLHFSCLEEDVGTKSGGNLIISNTDYYLSIPEKELREYVHSEELINRQNNILRSLMVGGDFILYPYGHSLQSLLSEISYNEDGNISSDFKLVKKNSTDGPHWRVGQFW